MSLVEKARPGYLTPEQAAVFALRRQHGDDRKTALLEALKAA